MSDLPRDDDFDLGEIEDADLQPDETEGPEGPAGGDEGPEGEADPAEDSEAEGAPEEGAGVGGPPRQGRKSQAQRWRERAERTEREATELKGRLSALEQRLQQPQPTYDPQAQARAEAAEREQLALMEPAAVAEHYYRKGVQQYQQALQHFQLQTQDQIDKRAYDDAARSSRLHQHYREKVESLLASERGRGNLGATREIILKYLVGEDAMERASRAAPRQRQQARGRVAGQQARPTGARSDAAPSRRPAGDSLEAARQRIKGQPIW